MTNFELLLAALVMKSTEKELNISLTPDEMVQLQMLVRDLVLESVGAPTDQLFGPKQVRFRLYFRGMKREPVIEVQQLHVKAVLLPSK